MVRTPPPEGHETPRQVADRTGWTRQQVYSLIRRKILKVKRGYGGTKRLIAVRSADVDELLERGA